VVPCRETLDGSSHLHLLNGYELGHDPGFKECQMMIPLRKETMMLEQTTQVVDALATFLGV
jgi:hypothetical protein